jgi:hypothetical protein
MQVAPPPSVRLHWIPVEPSWLVSAGLVVLAVLPHQIPSTGLRVLRSGLGSVLWFALSLAVAYKKPVLGVAMLMVLASVRIQSASEPFQAPILTKDTVQNKQRRWFQEEIMMEEPAIIQERTDRPQILLDKVDGEEHQKWFVEEQLDETPMGIQERPVPYATEYDDGNSS